MSATELLSKVDQFLAEQGIVERSTSEQSLELVWRNAPDSPIADVVDLIRTALSPPTEMYDWPEPSASTLVFARLTKRPWTGPEGSRRQRIVWKLTDEQLPTVARWLDQHESTIVLNSAFAFAHQHVSFRWLNHHQGEFPEFTEPMMFGTVLTHPRHIQVPLRFYDADHYRRIKKYMAEIGLSSLIDKYVLPKGSLANGV